MAANRPRVRVNSARISSQTLAPRRLSPAVFQGQSGSLHCHPTARRCRGSQDFGKWQLHQQILLVIDDFEGIGCRILPRTQLFKCDGQSSLAGIEIGRFERGKIRPNFVHESCAAGSMVEKEMGHQMAPLVDQFPSTEVLRVEFRERVTALLVQNQDSVLLTGRDLGLFNSSISGERANSSSCFFHYVLIERLTLDDVLVRSN